MKKAYQRRKILARGKTVSIGIDVHRINWHVTAWIEGEEVFHGSLPGQYHALQKLLERFPDCTIKVVYEAGPFGFWLYDKLTADGIETIVTPPSLIPVESGNRVKTDKRDSRKLAKLLENNMLKKVHVLSEAERADRELLRTQRQIVEHRSDLMRQIKSKLLLYGIVSPFTAKKGWSKRYIEWLKKLVCEQEMLKISLNFLIELYEYLTDQLKRIIKQVITLAHSDRYAKKVKLLKSVPGIGTLIATEIVVELQNIERFRSSEKIAAYIGLTPSEYSSGQYVRQGRITKCGNKWVRTCLVESSWHLIWKDPVMQYRYKKLKGRKGAKRAIIAIARHLIIRIRRMLLDNKPYVIGTV